MAKGLKKSMLMCCAVALSASAAQLGQSAKIDRLVRGKLQEVGLPSSERCGDEVFLRRAYLDVIGTLPTITEAKTFLGSSSLNKRAELIDALLKRPEYADYWSLKWCDLLRVKAEFPSKLWPNAVQAYHRWVRTALFENMPYDEFAGALLTSSGSNFREAPVNFYRAMPEREPETIARVVALTFMGSRTDRWPPERLQGMAAFFGGVAYKGTAEWKEEIVFHDPDRVYIPEGADEAYPPVLPDGTEVTLEANEDPRERFADWLLESDVFADNICNRVWYWLFGRGIIHEPDDIRPDNPASNPELLAYLRAEFRRADYDVRHLFRIILNSETYQRSSIHEPGNLEDETYFSRYYARRLGAEVLIDAICQITKTTEAYTSEIPEPFTFIPEKQRSIKLADGSITSPFLDLYGRPPRDTGYESERNDTPSAAQKLHLLNSTHIQRKIINNRSLLGMRTVPPKKGGQRKKPTTTWMDPPDAIEDMYLAVLSRYPSAREKEIAVAYLRDSGLSRFDASVDVVWALLNSKEFIFKH